MQQRAVFFQNAGQFVSNARLFSRICGRDQHVLEVRDISILL